MMKSPIIRYVAISAFFLSFGVLAAQTGHWKILPAKNPIANRSECGLAAVDNRLFLIGGDGPGNRAVQIFDPKTRKWTPGASAPLDMHHLQAVASGRKIYVLDAFSEGGFPNQIPMANVWMYDVDQNTWQKGIEIPQERRRAGAGAAAYLGQLYLVAGIQHGHSSGTTNMFDRYEPKANTWTPLPDAPHVRDHCSATVLKDKLYVVGGRNTSYHEPDNFMAFFGKTVLEVDCYDFKNGKWSTLSARLPLGSGGGAVVNDGEKLYYLGGERATATSPNGPQKNVYALNPETDQQWVEVENLHIARNGVAATVMSDRIYAIGGGSNGGAPGPPPAFSNNASGQPPMPPPPPSSDKGEPNNIAIEVYRLK